MGFFSRKLAAKAPPQTQITAPSPPSSPDLLPVAPTKKRLSTIVDDDQFSAFEKDDYDDSDDASVDSVPRDDNETSDSDYEEHNHVVLEKDRVPVSQLLVLMGHCGLGNLATSKESLRKISDELLKRTYSLLSNDVKITRLSPTMRKADPQFHDSVIGESQVELIEHLKRTINCILDSSGDPAGALACKKTLFERYGNVKDIIGRGAYGVIKFIDSGKPVAGKGSPNKIYAIKELAKRPPSASKQKETKDQFLDRVISEFILSSTLNNKHITRTLDLMILLPDQATSKASDLYEAVKFCQVMDCTSGGDLFSYCKKSIETHEFLSIDEIDCFIKQITKGVWYMHNHGVAHCDLKLENILIENDCKSGSGARTRMNLKISDFGKSNVVRTKWDLSEQLASASSLPVGSGPYIAPEEYLTSGSLSLIKKDCWALGVIILILFNIRRSFYYGGKSCQLEFYDRELKDTNSKSYGAAYLWHTTEPKLMRCNKYKDPVFGEFVANAMVSSYDAKTKEWSIKRPGKFVPIETMFTRPAQYESGKDSDEDGFEQDDFDIRKYCTYKMLDVEPSTRFSADTLLKSDWLTSVESCGD